MSVRVEHGDSREVIRTLPDASVDSCVTDPPYALVSIVKRFGAADAAPVVPGKTGAYARASAGFMGKKWDTGETAFDPAFWAEVLRVMKPGAHLLAFGGDRTFHRLACAIEDAGFEIRGTIFWVFGSGFPKSHNVSRTLAGSLPEHVQHACDRCDWQIVPGSQCDCPSCRGCGGAQPLPAEGCDLGAPPSQDDVPSHNHVDPRSGGLGAARANSALDEGSAHPSIADCSGPQARQSEDCRGRDSTSSGTASSTSPGESTAARRTATRKQHTSHSDDGSAFSSSANSRCKYANLPRCGTCGKRGIPSGLGTALKPAAELICLARKPLIGTVASNVLQHGTGALNIDACRVLLSTGQRPYEVRTWASDQRHCASCAALADLNAKHGTQETKAFSATNSAEPTSSGRGGTSQPATDRTVIGCSDGTRADDTATSSNTGASGKTPTDPSLADPKSTTSTKTAATTASKTCASCGRPITAATTSGSTIAAKKNSPLEGSNSASAAPASALGRWPANLVHDGSDEVLAAFPDTGPSKAAAGVVRFGRSGGIMGNVGALRDGRPEGHDDAGGSAARFFYSSKATAADRLGSKHPTVKPVDLMRYLCRLVTPPGGLVLDPFAGSGTTGMGCMAEGFDAILIEREAEYVADIHKRLQHVRGEDEGLFAPLADAPDSIDLFGSAAE